MAAALPAPVPLDRFALGIVRLQSRHELLELSGRASQGLVDRLNVAGEARFRDKVGIHAQPMLRPRLATFPVHKISALRELETH